MRLYHHTTPEVAQEIVKNQRFTKPIQSGMTSYYRNNIWASSVPHGHASGYGEVAVSFEVPDGVADLDDAFPDGEQHYAVDARHARDFRIHGVHESKHYATLNDPTSRAGYVQRHHRRYPTVRDEKEEKRSQRATIAKTSMGILISNFNRKLLARLSQIERLVQNPGSMASRRVNDILLQIRKDTLTSYHRSYRLGLESCGLGYRFASKRMVSEAEQRWVASAVKQELGYFSGLLQDMKAGKSLSSMTRRVTMYGEALKALYSAGQVSGMSPDTVVDWVVDPKAEHCEDCVFLSQNGPYTPETLPTTPGAGLCRCLSSCKCELRFRVVGEQIVNKVKSGSRSSASMLRSIQRAKQRRSKPV